jgi:hypothetical protein
MLKKVCVVLCISQFIFIKNAANAYEYAYLIPKVWAMAIAYRDCYHCDMFFFLQFFLVVVVSIFYLFEIVVVLYL